MAKGAYLGTNKVWSAGGGEEYNNALFGQIIEADSAPDNSWLPLDGRTIAASSKIPFITESSCTESYQYLEEDTKNTQCNNNGYYLNYTDSKKWNLRKVTYANDTFSYVNVLTNLTLSGVTYSYTARVCWVTDEYFIFVTSGKVHKYTISTNTLTSKTIAGSTCIYNDNYIVAITSTQISIIDTSLNVTTSTLDTTYSDWSIQGILNGNVILTHEDPESTYYVIPCIFNIRANELRDMGISTFGAFVWNDKYLIISGKYANRSAYVYEVSSYGWYSLVPTLNLYVNNTDTGGNRYYHILHNFLYVKWIPVVHQNNVLYKTYLDHNEIRNTTDYSRMEVCEDPDTGMLYKVNVRSSSFLIYKLTYRLPSKSGHFVKTNLEP